jgi:pyruvate dehydrogenase E2 component (dihydrolipoamide acetyltransferase)
MVDIVMPRLSDSMEEGTVLRWLRSVGDEVAVGDELVEIETDKANMVYEADAAGTVVEILAQEGDTLPVGDTIARVGDASEVVSGNGGGAGAASPAGRAGAEAEARAPDADQPAIGLREPAGAAAAAPPPGQSLIHHTHPTRPEPIWVCVMWL